MSTQPLRLEYLDPEQLDDNPANWKTHPAGQLGALDAFMSDVGWAGALLFNENTRRLLDGHGRKKLFRGKGPVPVLIGNWSEEQERKILLHLDPTGWTAETDRKAFDALLSTEGVRIASDDLAKLMDAVKATGRLLDEEKPAGDGALPDSKDGLDPAITIPLDSIWPSDNPYDVPSLLPELQADQVPHPVSTWGTVGHKRPMVGTWHFYVDDSKFEPLWKRPQRVLVSRPSAIVEPNFSTTDQTPLALALWHVYRKRWLGRYWQSNGLRLFVDLNCDSQFNISRDDLGGVRVNLLGVPRGWRAYASRAHANNPDALLGEWEVAKEWSGVESPLFLVVGGGKRVKALAKDHGWVWVPEQIQFAHGKASTSSHE